MVYAQLKSHSTLSFPTTSFWMKYLNLKRTMFSLESSNKLEDIYTNQNGRFPYTSNREYTYIMVAYHYNNKSIHCQPICDRKGIELETAYHNIHKELFHCSLALNYTYLDNEVSKNLKDYMKLVKEK